MTRASCQTCLADKMTIACSAWGQLAVSVLATYRWVNTGITCCIVDQCSQQIVLSSMMPIYLYIQYTLVLCAVPVMLLLKWRDLCAKTSSSDEASGTTSRHMPHLAMLDMTGLSAYKCYNVPRVIGQTSLIRLNDNDWPGGCLACV